MTVVLTVTICLGSSFDRMVWFGWEWYDFGLSCVEPYDLYYPFMDRTMRLIQHNWLVLTYNFNVVILVLIIGELSIGAFCLPFYYSFILVITSHYHFIPALVEYQR
jgi:hypothetical protein